MSDKFILDGKTVIPCDDLLTWAKWFETANRHVAKTVIGDSFVSTVFLGINHNFGKGKPLLFETMIFGEAHNEYQERYPTWKEAEVGHRRAVALVKKHA